MVGAGHAVAVDARNASAEAVAVEFQATRFFAVAGDPAARLRLALLRRLDERARRDEQCRARLCALLGIALVVCRVGSVELVVVPLE